MPIGPLQPNLPCHQTGGTDDGDTRTRFAAADTRNAAFLGRHQGERVAAAALRRVQQGVFPAAAVLPGLRVAQGLGDQGQRQGEAVQLRHPSPPGARLHAALRHRGGGTGRRPAHDDQHRRMRADAGGAGAGHAGRGGVRAADRHHHASLVPSRRKADPMPHNTVAVVGAAETTKLGVIPDLSQIGLHADAALNAMADCGLKPKDIDGIATRRRNAGAARALPRHHADLGRRHLGRRLQLHDPCPPRRGGDRGRAGEDHPDHAWRMRQIPDRQPAAFGASAVAERPVRAAVRADGAAVACSPSRCCAT